MKEEKPNSFSSFNHTTTLRFFTPPKIKIKMPNLIFINKKKWAKPRIHLPKKVGAIINNVFGNKKSAGICSSIGGNDSNCDDLWQEERETEFINRGNCLNCEDTFSKSHSLKGNLEIEEEGKQGKIDDQNSSQPLKVMSLYFSGFFSKRNGLNFTKLRIQKGRSGNSVVGNQESSRKLGKVTSRGLSGYRRMMRGRYIGKKVRKQGEEEESGGDGKDGEKERGGEELCKKRILMGEKCRPLNMSGTLHYDKNGILLPEEVIL